METINKKARLPLLEGCSFNGYDTASLTKVTAKLGKLSLKEERLKFLFHSVPDLSRKPLLQQLQTAKILN
jgi:hypothetical protein